MSIINNSKIDPNKILPMKYIWARQYYKDGVANNWTPEEIELNSIQYILQHHSNQPLSQDFSCNWCYPPTLSLLTLLLFRIFGIGLIMNSKPTLTLHKL